MKEVIRRIARNLGWEIVSTRHVMLRHLQTPPRSLLDEVLLRCFPTLDGLNFIQVGANDGVRCDPVRHHVLRHGWHGVLLEPVPALFQALRRNYAGQPHLTLLNAAIDQTSGQRTIYQLRDDRGELPDWTRGLASFDRERLHAAAGKFHLPASAVVSEQVATITWEEVWRQFGERACDVLVVDTEGHDVALLRAAGLAARRPRVIQFEHACVPAAERIAFYGELIELGYDLATRDGDTVASLPQ